MSDFIVEITPEFEAAYRRTHMLQARAVRAMIHANAQPPGPQRGADPDSFSYRVRMLAAGESALFGQYSDTTQVSSRLAYIAKTTGCMYCSRKQRSLIDGSIEGVLVSRIE